MAATKRGAHLALSLERLEQLTEPAARSASACRPPSGRSTSWPAGSGGADRPVTIVDAGVRKPLELQIDRAGRGHGEPAAGPVDGGADRGAAAGAPEVRASIWPAVYPTLAGADPLAPLHADLRQLAAPGRAAGRPAERAGRGRGHRPGPTGGSAYHRGGRRPRAGAGPPRLHRPASSAWRSRTTSRPAGCPRWWPPAAWSSGSTWAPSTWSSRWRRPTSVASGLQRIGRAGHQVGAAVQGPHLPQVPPRPARGRRGRHADARRPDRGDAACPATRSTCWPSRSSPWSPSSRRPGAGRRGGRSWCAGPSRSPTCRRGRLRGRARHAGRSLPERRVRRAAAPAWSGTGWPAP